MDSSDSMTLPNKGVGKNDGWWDKYCATAGYHSHSASISSTGSNQPYSIMQPYITVFMWHRTTQRLPVGELPSHSHNVTVSTSGNHAHTFTFVKEYDAGGTEPGSASWRSNQGTKTTEQAGAHTHTVTISNTGSNSPHNNLQPYIAVFMWRRTA